MFIGASTGLDLQCLPSAKTVEELAPHRARFSLKPLERGFGTTLGVALRRVLMLPGLPCAPSQQRRRDGEGLGDGPARSRDTTCSPLLQMAAAVAPTRWARRTDLDQLVMDIATDGTITPLEVLDQAAGALARALEPFAIPDDRPAIPMDPPLGIAWQPIEALGLSLRTTGCLRDQHISFLGDLARHTETDLLRFPCLGRKRINEIKAALLERGLTLAAGLENWPPPSAGR